MKGMNKLGMLVVVGVSATIFASTPTNLFTNGGFENSTNPVLGWSFEKNNDTAKATRVIDSTSGTAKEGKNFCRINVTAVSGSDWHVQMKDPSWAAKMGNVYYFSIWARSDSTRSAAISIYGGPDGVYTYRTGSKMALTKEWQQFEQLFPADVEGTGAINFALVVGGQVGTYDFDGAVLTESAPVAGIYQNGSFETSGAGWSLWTKTDSGSTGKATMTFPTTGAKSGAKYCQIKVTDAAANAYEVQLQDGSWTCKNNYIYTFKFWGKADSVRTITVAAQPGQTRSYTDLASEPKELTTDWSEQVFTYTTTDLEGKDSLSFVIYCGASKGTFDFDSVTLTEEVDPTIVVQQNRGVVKTAANQPLSITLFSDRLQCTAAATSTAPFNVEILSIQGRVFSTRTIAAAGRMFDLPRPPSGTWIVRVNSNPGNTIIVP